MQFIARPRLFTPHFEKQKYDIQAANSPYSLDEFLTSNTPRTQK